MSESETDHSVEQSNPKARKKMVSESESETDHSVEQPQPKRGKRAISESDIKEFADKEKAKGVIYISRVPPHMKPQKIRHLLGQYGEIGRVYLTPEDEKSRQRRVKTGGNKKKNFVDGWVEFMDKRIAKSVAISLNSTPMGGSKRSYYHDDLWNIKYLSGFKWHHLTERLAYERAIKDVKMKQEMTQAKKERDFYLEQVQKAKRKDKIEAKVEKKRKAVQAENSEASGDDHEGLSSKPVPPAKRPRFFKLKEEVSAKDDAAKKGALSKLLFGG
eukprot:tig00020554_g10832.t1